MGYYSDVMVSTTREGYERIKELAGDGMNGHEVKVCAADSVVFGWDGVKWYPYFDEVADVMWALHQAADEGIPWEYVEVGEDGRADWEVSEDDEYPNPGLKYHIEAQTNIAIWK